MPKTDNKIPEGQRKYCEGCGKTIHIKARICPFCGYSLSSEKNISAIRAIVGLIFNVLIWPGLGTIVGGETGTGIIQMIAAIISIPLIFILIGIPLLIGVWIWALISSIRQIKKAER